MTLAVAEALTPNEPLNPNEPNRTVVAISGHMVAISGLWLTGHTWEEI